MEEVADIWRWISGRLGATPATVSTPVQAPLADDGVDLSQLFFHAVDLRVGHREADIITLELFELLLALLEGGDVVGSLGPVHESQPATTPLSLWNLHCECLTCKEEDLDVYTCWV